MKICPICKKHVKSLKNHKCKELTQSEKEALIRKNVEKMDVKSYFFEGGVLH